jgi:hypothetical protein
LEANRKLLPQYSLQYPEIAAIFDADNDTVIDKSK